MGISLLLVVLIPAASQRVGFEPVVSMRDASRPAKSTGKRSYEVAVSGADWIDSGADVTAGEVLSASVTGSVTLADGRIANAEGLPRGWRDLLRQFPLNGAPAGALIGRVSDLDATLPFLIGGESKVTLPTTGRLFLRINVSSDLASSDLTSKQGFRVKLHLSDAGKPKLSSDDQTTLSTLVGPDTFATLPRRVADKDGNLGDMVNFALIGTETQVKASFKAAGWVAVDQSVQDAVLHGILSTLGHEAYTEMPMSTLYLFGRPQDLSFARGDPLKVAAVRHHLRVWRTREQIGGEPLWIGSATHDVGFERDQRNGNVTHKIDPNVDDERDFLLKSFDAAGMFHQAAYITPTDSLRSARTATGGEFHTDGRIVVMALPHSAP